ncbi:MULTISPECIES: polyprenyl synthetase family protein [unclassified Streptomyces]|uniref:polyprenyl synthetase family protein n=1 Tax=unclassified Streptomyces TaxID=2593676 RepID=UPI0023495FD0|nr:polyprenyl synthetase family protein [Streptomyces sp. M92]WCN05631.1 polyprenyl synthetase family protein [Streptomyces sp. M92]
MSQITDSAPAGAFPRLDWVDDVLSPALRAAVESLPAAESLVARYHRGWCEADGEPRTSASGGGKVVRPALTLLSAVAVGGSPSDAVPGAVAVELVHDFTLLHDDVIDGDALRRHRPAAWSLFGTPAAVLTGDALLVAAMRVLAQTPPARAGAAVQELVGALLELVEGQSHDVAFEKAHDVTVADYLAMAAGKTGALIGCACALGGVLAGADSVRVGGLRDFGRHLGVAFQCADDILGIWGRTARSGKPVGADLAARKKSLPVVAALAAPGAAAGRLRELYRAPHPLTEDDVDLARHLVEEAGGRQAAEEEARRQTAAALRSLSLARPTADAYRQLHDVARSMTRRES